MNQKEVVTPQDPIVSITDEEITLITDVISAEIMTQPYITPCGHSFQKSSIDGWLDKHDKCPNCNFVIKKEDLINDKDFSRLINTLTLQETLTSHILTLDKEAVKIFVDPFTGTLITDPVLTTCCQTLYDKASFGILCTENKCCDKSSKKAVTHFRLKEFMANVYEQLKVIDTINAYKKGLETCDIKDVKDCLVGMPFLVDLCLAPNESPLHYAVKRCSKELVEVLIHAGADLKKKDANSQTAKQLAESLKFTEISAIFNAQVVELYGKAFKLISENRIVDASKNFSDIYNDYGFEQLCAFIYECKTKFEKQFNEICAATIRKLGLHFIKNITPEKKYFLEELLDAAPSLIDEIIDGYTLLHIATQHGNIELMESLIKSGADVNKPFENEHKGATAFMLACEINCLPAIQLLVKHNANINAISQSQAAAIFIAIYKNHLDVVNYLLQLKNLDLNIYYKDLTPFQFAVYCQRKEIVSSFVNHKIDVNKKSVKGQTALHIAIEKDEKEIVAILLKHPLIDIEIKDDANKTPEQLAAEKNSLDIFALFTDPNLGQAKIRKYVENKQHQQAVSYLIEYYRNFQVTNTVSLLRTICKVLSEEDYKKICEDTFEKLYPELLEISKLDLFLALVMKGGKALVDSARECFKQQKFLHLTLVLAFLKDLLDKPLMEKLVLEKAKLCEQLFTQLNFIKVNNLELAKSILKNTISASNALGKIIQKKPPMFDLGSSERLHKELIEYHDKNFSHTNDYAITVRA